MRILQIAPEIAPGSGVGGVAHHLESAFRRAGHETTRFTMADARAEWLPEPGAGLVGKLALLARVGWFSTVGTLLARRAVARPVARGGPDASICHNDVLAGDVYVNHGILRVAMRARGGYWWRMVRNPLHLFTAVRDSARYRSGTHRVVVNLTGSEERALHETYPRLRPRTTVIANGVDTARFVPASSASDTAQARHAVGVPEGALHVVFVGHEYDRKGLAILLRAAANLPDAFVSVVGGTPDMVAAARNALGDHEVASRVHFAGQVTDPRPWLRAADALALPSAYEANALVVLEALSCGVPVVSTRVGYAPDVIVDGVNGYLTERTAGSVHDALGRLAGLPAVERADMSAAARRSAETHDWDEVAARYLELLTDLEATR